VGQIGLGSSQADAQAKGVTQAYVDQSGTVTTGGDLAIIAVGSN